MGRLLDRYFAPVPALRWVTVRMLLGLFVSLYSLARMRVLTDFSRYEAERFAPVGLATWVEHPVPHGVSIAVWAATVLLGVLVAAGVRARITVAALTLGWLWTTSYRSSWGMLFHTENLVSLHLCVLTLGTWMQRQARDAADTFSGWPLRLMTAITLATYVLAGVAKLRNSGLEWMDGEILRNTIAHDALRKAELGSTYAQLGAAMVQHAGLFMPLAWATLVLELGAPLALLHRYARWAWIATAWSFHFGVQWIMWIGFPYPLSLVAYASLLPVEKVWSLPMMRDIHARLQRSRLAPFGELGQA